MEGGRESTNAREAVDYLETKINERKAQERRKKILDGIDLIRKRRNDVKSESLCPVSRGQDQENWFLKLESNGIWQYVFHYLTSLTDVHNAYLSCEMFRTNLEKKLQLMQLPKVFQVLQDTSYMRYIDTTSSIQHLNWIGREMGDSLDIPSRRDEERDKKRNVLNLRLLSKGWKTAAEEEFLLKPLGLGQLSDEHTGWKSLVCFSSTNDVTVAMEALPLKNTVSSLIQTVAISDCEYYGAGVEEFYTILNKFLDVHGESTWGLNFHFNRRNRSAAFVYKDLRNVLTRLPNLRSLEVFSYHFDEDEDDSNEIMTLEPPLPTMASLKQCRFLTLVNDSLIAEILSKAPGLKTVQLRDLNIDAVWRSLGALQYLEDFELHCGSRYEDLDGVLHRLEEVVAWPLKKFKLQMTFDVFDHDVSVEASRLFAVLQRFNATLEDAEIKGEVLDGEGTNVELINDSRFAIEDFPNLKRIVLP